MANQMNEPQTIAEAIEMLQALVDWFEPKADDDENAAIVLELLERALDKLASALPSADR